MATGGFLSRERLSSLMIAELAGFTKILEKMDKNPKSPNPADIYRALGIVRGFEMAMEVVRTMAPADMFQDIQN
jgi:hypothetical protein